MIQCILTHLFSKDIDWKKVQIAKLPIRNFANASFFRPCQIDFYFVSKTDMRGWKGWFWWILCDDIFGQNLLRHPVERKINRVNRGMFYVHFFKHCTSIARALNVCLKRLFRQKPLTPRTSVCNLTWGSRVPFFASRIDWAKFLCSHNQPKNGK